MYTGREGAMGSNKFDKKFGAQFIKQVPREPGVYLFYNVEGEICYVGKAKNLRARLSQYRNAKPIKANRKVRSILVDAARLEFELCASEEEALLKEARLIQTHRPRWNVVGAFWFLYPYFGIRRTPQGDGEFVFTTQPEKFPEFELHGAYRSRGYCLEVFTALTRLLDYCAHRDKGLGLQKLRARARFSPVVRYRCLDDGIFEALRSFLRGDSDEALGRICLHVVENAGARRDSMQVQADLALLREFWGEEIVPLRRVVGSTGFDAWPVPQAERDVLFLQARFRQA